MKSLADDTFSGMELVAKTDDRPESTEGGFEGNLSANGQSTIERTTQAPEVQDLVEALCGTTERGGLAWLCLWQQTPVTMLRIAGVLIAPKKRRGGDSNPRCAFDAHTLSKGAPSATRTPLQSRPYDCVFGRKSQRTDAPSGRVNHLAGQNGVPDFQIASDIPGEQEHRSLFAKLQGAQMIQTHIPSWIGCG